MLYLKKDDFLIGFLCPGKNRLGSDENQVETAEDLKKSMTNEEWETVYKMSQDKNLYQNLIQSMFPTIHGNDEVKRGIMLMLFGGVPKTTLDGSSLRFGISDVDPDPVGSGFIWVRGSGFWIQIKRYKIIDKMEGKAEFNQQKSFFFAGNYIFQVWT